MALTSTGSILPLKTEVFARTPPQSISMASTDGIDGTTADTANFAKFLGELHTACAGKYMITATLPSSYCT